MNRVALLAAAIAFPAGVALAAVDVNTATRAELEAEGVGSAAAQAIIDHRTRNGPFKSSEEVQRVISDAIAAKLKIGISISGPASAKTAAPQEKPAEAKAAPKGKDAQEPGNVRERAEKDREDRKT